MTNIRKAAILALLTSVSILPAKAVLITLGSTQYDVTSKQTSYNGDSVLLQSQPWWGNATLANEAAEAVGGALGFPNGLVYGPAFAYEVEVQPFSTAVNSRLFTTAGIYFQLPAESAGVWYAIAEPVRNTTVPDGGNVTAMLLFGSLAVGVRWRRR